MTVKDNYPWDEGYEYEQKYNYYNEDRNAGHYFHEAINTKYNYIEKLACKNVANRKKLQA